MIFKISYFSICMWWWANERKRYVLVRSFHAIIYTKNGSKYVCYIKKKKK